MSATIRVRVPGRPDVDLSVDPAGDHDELVDLIARYVGVDPDDCVLRDIESGTDVRADGIIHGTAVALEPRSEIPASLDSTDAWEVTVVDGPDLGRRWILNPGLHRIGRGATNISLLDPTVSRTHATISVLADACLIEDTRSTSGTTIDGNEVNTPTAISSEGTLIRVGNTALTLAPHVTPAAHPDPRGRIGHNRPPRVPPYRLAALALAAPPSKPARARLTLLTACVPIAAGVAMWLMMHNPYALIMAAFSPVAVGAQWLIERRRGTKQWRTLRREYRTLIAETVSECQTRALRWQTGSAAQFPGPSDLLRRARGRAPECWDRRPEDADFGLVRIAAEDPLARIRVDLGAGGAPELRIEAERALLDVQSVPMIPVTVDLRAGAIGVAGDGALPTTQWIVSALAATHSPRDVRIAICAGDDLHDAWAFTTWLPHTDATDIIGTPSLVGRSTTRATDLLNNLDALVTRRRGLRSNDELTPLVVAVIGDVHACDPAVVARLAEHGASVGVSLIVAAPTTADLPGACTTIIGTGVGASMVRTPDDLVRTAVRFDRMPTFALDAHARALAALRDTSTAATSAHLPGFVRLADCLDGTDPDAVVRRWDASRCGAPLAAPLGVGLDGPITIDLRAHGPHALIAGTTGAGKSALLQTFVASFAACHAPERLTFVLIDYKGGAAFGPCVALPHVGGMVTDLEGGLAQRVLVALEAELRRREAVLRDAGVADLAALERQDMTLAPPNVCIIIDEFAALVREVPNFVDGMVDLAQRGRSLGMHLILATQKPAGVVNDRIRANTALRIALRTTDASDSIDVIGSDDAARIHRTHSGRGFIGFSAHERLPMQSAYVGAPVAGPGVTHRVSLVDDGRCLPVAEPPPDASEHETITDLDALVETLQVAAQDCRPTDAPWLEPLPSAIPLETLIAPTTTPRNAVLAIGRRDEPARQAQPVHTVDLDDVGAILVTGGAASGKSTTLLTLAGAAARANGPAALNIHLLDDGTGALRMLDTLPHFGYAAAVHDLEGTTRFLEYLDRELDSRRALLRDRSASDWRTLLDHTPDAPPRLLVLLDGLGGFLHAYERLDAGRWLDLLTRLIGDSRACGVHWCVATERRSGLPPALLAHATERIDLGGDPDGGPSGITRGPTIPTRPTAQPGRACARGDEVQIAHLGCAPTRGAALAALQAIASTYPEPHTPAAIPFDLPTDVDLAAIDLGTDSPSLTPPIGVDDNGALVRIDLSAESLVVCGPRGSGRSSILETIAAGIRNDADIIRIDARADGPELAAVRLKTLLAGITDALEANVGRIRPTVVLIDDADLLTDGDAATALETIAKLGQRHPVRIVAACDPFTVARSFSAWVGELRRTRRALLLQPMIATDGDPFGVRLRARPGLAFPPGRGFLIERGEARIVHCAQI